MVATHAVGVTGATGLIGRALTRSFLDDGVGVVALGRSGGPPAGFPEGVRFVQWNPMDPDAALPELSGCRSVIHLAGEPVGARWTSARRRAIPESRVVGTRNLGAALGRLESPPARFLGASAVGFYGDRGDEELDEDSAPGEGFLAETCRDWEAASRSVGDCGARVAVFRIGHVLSVDGGALAKMLLPFRLGLGGPIGSGRQWMPWIHVADVVAAIRHLESLPPDGLSPAYNLVGPTPVRNREFAKALGRALRRPAFLPAPGFALRLILGEMARELLLSGQRASSRRLAASGFAFRHSDLDGALADLLR